ncbi:MAG: hypothetical protein WCG27_02700 [Pseudomonadota bacterium]
MKVLKIFGLIGILFLGTVLILFLRVNVILPWLDEPSKIQHELKIDKPFTPLGISEHIITRATFGEISKFFSVPISFDDEVNAVFLRLTKTLSNQMKFNISFEYEAKKDEKVDKNNLGSYSPQNILISYYETYNTTSNPSFNLPLPLLFADVSNYTSDSNKEKKFSDVIQFLDTKKGNRVVSFNLPIPGLKKADLDIGYQTYRHNKTNSQYFKYSLERN